MKISDLLTQVLSLLLTRLLELPALTAERVGFDGVAQAMSGAMDMTGGSEQPTKAYAPYVDFCSASLAAFGTLLLAFFERQKTGQGSKSPNLLTTDRVDYY